MIENEKKFIVRWDEDLECRLKRKYGWFNIEQHYLNGKTRIRRRRSITHEEFFFTYKQKLPNGRSIEIETTISANDYYSLSEFTTESIYKQRISVRDNDVQWDIDLPIWVNGKHFIVAEAEMPETMEAPPRVLPELVPYVVLAVARGDCRFNARRLIDPEYTQSLARDLGI